MENYKNFILSVKDIPNLDVEKLENSFEKDLKKGIRFNTKKLKINENISKNLEKTIKNGDFFENFDNFSSVAWCESGFCFDKNERLGKNIFHEMGLYYLQEPSAMSPVEFLDVEPNDVVLDLCASPGGKSTQIANKLNGGFLVANEIVPSRAKTLAENVVRLGYDNVVVTNHSPKDIENRFENFFDKILVDAPCSGEGMFRKNHDAINEWDLSTPKQCATRQKEIVLSAYKMLKPNGKMVYSTCTFSLEENEEVIKFLLDTFDDLEIESVEHNKFGFSEGVDIDGTQRLLNCARLYPYNIEGEGHFFAVLHKKDKDFVTNNQKAKNQAKRHDVEVFENFAKKHIDRQFENYVSIGEKLFANCKINIDKLKVVLPGLFLGEIKKDNFVPSFHLAHSLFCKEFDCVQEITLDDAKKYLEGYELNSNQKNGWVLLAHNNLPLSFGKVVDGKIKNHYPKTLRKKL